MKRLIIALVVVIAVTAAIPGNKTMRENSYLNNDMIEVTFNQYNL